MEGIKPMRLFDEETIKIWLVNIGAVLVTVSEAAGAVISFLGSLAATTYTIWRIWLLYKSEKRKKKNELD